MKRFPGSTREAPIVGILLAAGAGTRFGGDKLMHPLPDGRPMAVAAASALVRALPESVAVVRPGNDALERALAAAGLTVTVCADAAEGMGASLAHGIRSTDDAAGWVIALADMPFVKPATIAAVAQKIAAGATLCAPSVGGLRGHPVGLSAAYRSELEALHGDAGARDILRRDAARLELVAVDDSGVLRDIDARADLPSET
jgi:molybdenum cofactor cytidylyltransferase